MKLAKPLLLLAAALVASCASQPSTPVSGKGKTTKSTPAKEAPALSAKDKKEFATFYANLKAEAAQKGLNANALDEAFGGEPQPITSVLMAEQTQPETTRTFAAYVGPMLSEQRITTARSKMQEHRRPLENISNHTGVPVGTMVALWGIETNFGARQGENPILPSLITLSWRSARADYFRSEVFAALKVLDKTGMHPADLKGSWAGAMGQCQFMPSNYLAYAKDGDGDGKADIWTNEDDVFASTATFLKAKGWKGGQPWRVQLAGPVNTSGVTVNARGLSDPLPLKEWQKRGLKAAKGASFKGLPAYAPSRIYEPEPGGPVYLLGPNFDVVLKWNNSSYFAYSVLTLSDILESGQ